MSAFERLSRSCGPVPPPELLADIDAFRAEVEREVRAEVQAEDSAAVANLMAAVHDVVTPAQTEALRQAVNVIGSGRTGVEAERDRLRKELDEVQRRYTEDTAELKRTVEYFDEQSKRRKAERDRYRLAWQSARERAVAYSEGILRITKDRETYQGWLKEAEAKLLKLQYGCETPESHLYGCACQRAEVAS